MDRAPKKFEVKEEEEKLTKKKKDYAFVESFTYQPMMAQKSPPSTPCHKTIAGASARFMQKDAYYCVFTVEVKRSTQLQVEKATAGIQRCRECTSYYRCLNCRWRW